MLSSYLPAIDSDEDVVGQSLEAVRRLLGMDAAYLSEIVEGHAVFRRVMAPDPDIAAKEGDADALENVYCGHIIAGRLPQLLPNTAEHELARSMPITRMIPIGAHVSVPIHLSDGRLYGNFTCISNKPIETLNERDLQMATLFAQITARQLSKEFDTRRRVDGNAWRIRDVLAQSAFDIAYQPIRAIDSLRVAGYESLCRFRPEPYRSPDAWFAEAEMAGLGTDLELAVIVKALGGLSRLPDGQYLSFNAAPATILSGRLDGVLDGLPLDRLVLEITEHKEVTDYGELIAALKPLRDAGLHLAVDDAGAGYSSLQHIVQIAPDIIKLDTSLTQGVDIDPVRRALTAALIFFARETGTRLVAEGVETQAELETLKLLGVGMAQGFLLGRPEPLPRAQSQLTGT